MNFSDAIWLKFSSEKDSYNLSNSSERNILDGTFQ